MKSFYVECQLPQVARAEVSAAFDTFDEALAWIAGRVRENPQRLPRLISSVHITAKMARTLAAKGVIVERFQETRPGIPPRRSERSSLL